MSSTPKHSVSVAGVVIDAQDRILAIQRQDNGQWQAPGGVLELEESIEDGVAREVAEETGISIKVEKLTGVYKNIPLGVVALVFRCSPVSGIARPTAEARAVRWLTKAEASELMAPAFAIRVLDAFGTETAVRAHDGVNLL